MKTKDIFRAFRYYKLEQTPNPKTGQRQPLPSIKFLILFVALGIVGLLIFLSFKQESADDGHVLTDSPSTSDNSTSPSPTGSQSGADEEAPATPMGVFAEPSRKH